MNRLAKPSPRLIPFGLAGLAAGCLLLGALFAATADQRGAAQPPAGATVTEELGGPERYLTHVATDKPVYRPGERLYVRAAVLRADTRAPLPDGRGAAALVEVRGPKGDTVASGYAPAQDGVVGFAWDVPPATPGGQYAVKVSHPWLGHAPGERTFDVRAYRAPRLKSQTVFLRDGYGPGDAAGATLHVERAEGGIPAGAKVTAVARVDGVEVHRAETTVDPAGNCAARFTLPNSISRGEGTLAWLIEDGGVVETATKTIPILLQTLDLTMYPEGGDLVAGLPGRVYVEAFTPAKKPADFAAVVVDAEGHEVATFRTAHEGRGRFDFRPVASERYTLKVIEPAGIKTTYALPAVKESGAVLSCDDAVVARGEPVRLRVASSAAGKVRVTLAKHETEVASRTVTFTAAAAAAGDAERKAGGRAPAARAGGRGVEVELTPPDGADGVLVATAWGEAGKPLAERLVFRQPDRSVNITVTPDQSNYVPGGAATLTVATTDEAGKPVSALVGLTVTDDSVLELIEKREQAPRLPAMALLESDVRELADAHVYLDPADPKAPAALDLLLGTQGWRRFAFVERERFVRDNGDAARRVLALRVVTERELAKFNRARDFDAAVLPAAAAAPGAAENPAPADAIDAAAAPEPDAAPARKDADAAEAQDAVAVDEREVGRQQAHPAAAADEAAEAGAPALNDALPQQPAGAGGALKAELENLQKLAEDRADALGGRGRFADEAARNDFVAVREYAHAARPERRPGDRVDFTETLYWNAAVRTDAQTGRATVSFATCDAVTAFRVSADAFTAAGALGAGSAEVRSVQPFYVEPKLPLQVTSGDVIRLPVALVNGTTGELSAASVRASAAAGIELSQVEPLNLPAGGRARRLLEVRLGEYVGTTDLVLDATAGGGYADRVTRKLDVRPLGFPVELAFGGLIGPEAPLASYDIEIPADVVPNSVTSELAVYPTPLANITQALEALLQSPSGCFEQTSSTTYPLVMAQQYFLTHTGVDPALVEKSRALLDDGYQRLVGFECKTTKGFEWFGADPGHEALSAYGLLEFTDMAQIRTVDPRLLADTRKFVAGCRDGKGGFKRDRPTLHTWIADPECSNGYITWALLECGEKGLEREVAWVKDAASKTGNSYVTALGANVMSLAGDRDAAKRLMEKLAAAQTKDGNVDGATTSIVGSGGEALQIETTALATLAWLREPAFAGNVERSMAWLAEVCKAGRFGSTQSTVLALRAIVAYDKARAHPKAPGTVQVSVDGRPMGGAQPFSAETQGAIELQDVSEMLSPGKHKLELRMSDGSSMPFAVAVRYNATRPPSSEQCKVSVGVKLGDAEMTEGGVTEAQVTVTNRDADAPVPTPIAIVGIPGGLEVRHDQLKELVKSGQVDAYEVIGREVVLYWRSMKPGQETTVPLSLVAAVPGTYTAPASRAYLYYTDEFKHWVPGLTVEITPAAQD